MYQVDGGDRRNDPAVVRRTETDRICLQLCQRLAALLDVDPASLVEGQELPLAWTSILFPTVVVQSDLGRDGHANRGSFIPAGLSPRRVFAGRTLTRLGPLRIGDTVERSSAIAKVEHKQGRRGPFELVTLRHEVSSPAGPGYEEIQKIIYHDGVVAGGQAEGSDAGIAPSCWSREIRIDETMLFRYSALTFNSHRIHYDLPYATAVEGYPGLVVNGGLTALLLAQFSREVLSAPALEYEMRAVGPLYAGQNISLRGRSTVEGGEFDAFAEHGGLAFSVRVKVAG
ncbi:MaoC family dehydratase N-terminal domain-containing protein [Sphingobium sp. V4]|uniref:FAS1-like dehydratase domain-containing protein n=1 Tax=Sphingobium sp. V4 TaxID=3038927 RepID=UPI00255827DF|nr:MaoC family dehydratase N-terminal domain-containing protein [Sphingobium sp. V4]WIW89486.1 MaoC family dehydratase N-terminal domain-containing protein [Sphingobium sp. V4]